MTLEDKLKHMIIEEFALDDTKPAEVQDDTPLFGVGLGLDSLDAVELVVLLKKHFQVEVKDMEQGREVFATIRSLADYVRANRPAA